MVQNVILTLFICRTLPKAICSSFKSFCWVELLVLYIYIVYIWNIAILLFPLLPTNICKDNIVFQLWKSCVFHVFFQCSCYSLSFYNLLFKNKTCRVTNEGLSPSLSSTLHFIIMLWMCQYGEGVTLRADGLAEAVFCKGVIQTRGRSVIQKSSPVHSCIKRMSLSAFSSW